MNSIKTQLVVTTGTNLFQHRMPRNSKTEPCASVSYSVEKDYVEDSKSILAEIKGEDIDITSDNDEDELEILRLSFCER